jgi:mono/diheme cytochrome c family protein
MLRSAAIALFVFAVPQFASAQPFPAEDSLNPVQKTGRALFTQHCLVCHVHTQITGGAHFGPDLSSKSLGGQEKLLAEVIGNGSPNMPGFKYVFAPQQIAAIAAYVKSLPPPAPSAPAPSEPAPAAPTSMSR